MREEEGKSVYAVGESGAAAGGCRNVGRCVYSGTQFCPGSRRCWVLLEQHSWEEGFEDKEDSVWSKREGGRGGMAVVCVESGEQFKSVNALARAIGMSRSSLHQRLKANPRYAKGNDGKHYRLAS